jgi:uncharacterized OB-fold protein
MEGNVVPRVAIPLNPEFNWSVGNWVENFFDGLKEGKFMASKCPSCGRVYLIPRMICEHCFTKAEDWVELPDTGTVESFTVANVKVAVNGDLEDLASPEVIAMVKHDGADTCLAARLETDKPAVGMLVQAVLDTSAENVLDILTAYRPV